MMVWSRPLLSVWMSTLQPARQNTPATEINTRPTCNSSPRELLPYIEEKYSIRQTKDERIVAGDSLGGTVSLHLALDYPGLFSNVLSFSGAFYEITRQQLAASGDLSWLNLYMIIGLDELAVETDHGTINFLEENRLTHGLLKQKGTRLFYEEKPGKHLWGFWQKEIPAALRHFLG